MYKLCYSICLEFSYLAIDYVIHVARVVQCLVPISPKIVSQSGN